MLHTPVSDATQFMPHHINLESFQEAVDLGCYLCSTIWRNTYEEQHDILNEFFKMKYIFGYHPQGDPQTVTILHTDPFRSPAERIMTWSRFCIIPSEGKPIRNALKYAS